MRRLAVLVTALALGAATLVTPASAAETPQAAPPPLPSSMAAIGDSITQAVDVCCWYGDHPANSWSTGGAIWDGIASHYERIRAANPAMHGNNDNNAVAGARMSAGPGQAQQAVAQGAQYVTILLGANDVCTSSPSTMTPVETFRAQLQQTLQTLDAGLPPGALVFVASIPDIHRLWEIYHNDWRAQLVWALADICQSMLAPGRSAADRQLVRERNIAFNDVLEQECAQYAACRFDGDAVFDFRFERSDISRLDFFHPSLAGQARLAQVTWAASWWG
jgi:lysophospholipase L1-like esterase